MRSLNDYQNQRIELQLVLSENNIQYDLKNLNGERTMTLRTRMIKNKEEKNLDKIIKDYYNRNIKNFYPIGEEK